MSLPMIYRAPWCLATTTNGHERLMALASGLRGGSIAVLDCKRRNLAKLPIPAIYMRQGSLFMEPTKSADVIRSGIMHTVEFRNKAGKSLLALVVSTKDTGSGLVVNSMFVNEGDVFGMYGGVKLSV